MKTRYVAWMKSPGSPGLGCSVAIGDAADVEFQARSIAETPRWRAHHETTEITITRDPLRQTVVKTFLVSPLPAVVHEKEKPR